MIFEKVQEVISEQMDLDKDSITMDTHFLDDLGADSLDIFQVIDELEDIYEIDFDTSALENIRTVSDAVNYIKEAIQ